MHVQFTTPSAGATVAGGKTMQVQWKDSGDDPPLKDLQTYQLFLCAGGNEDENFIQLTNLVKDGKFSSGNSASGAVSAGIGGPDKNA
ncbi:uncharacterized protein KY384_003144 [Bacidia gigantensis]|uniref:uncharacterized protein n=1 Tax=Bacidia gigantensis TaxID=2732470 RepID=UPI001D05AC0A|nr:uncharacterized protein KY384_003144 [Bacidia gigantensis]KAG8531515.1 hypothetical protein KY384_003144 [Bacidia gigantensis]